MASYCLLCKGTFDTDETWEAHMPGCMADATRPLYKPGDRVQLHPATDAWMRGDRFGEIRTVGISRVTGTPVYTIGMDASDRFLRVQERNILGVV